MNDNKTKKLIIIPKKKATSNRILIVKNSKDLSRGTKLKGYSMEG